MLSLTLPLIRRLLGGIRRRADAGAADLAGPDLIFRLKAWPRLHDGARTAEVYRMLSLMSNQPLSRRWLLAHSSMTAPQLDALLGRLAHQGALEVIDPARFGTEAVALAPSA